MTKESVGTGYTQGSAYVRHLPGKNIFEYNGISKQMAIFMFLLDHMRVLQTLLIEKRSEKNLI